ncbi:MAG: hypothetical protein AABY14_03150, partial [Nanoarchaeota archaeon]
MAQDFYSGCSGAKAVQIDTYANHSGGKTSGMVVPKLFAKNLDKSLPNTIMATPFSISEDRKVENKGINLGYIAVKEYGNFIGAIGLFKDNDGKYDVLNPQLYFTSIKGHWTFDLEGNLPINLRNRESGGSISTTLGYGISDRLRVGGSITKEKGKDLEYRANVRVDITKYHKYLI